MGKKLASRTALFVLVIGVVLAFSFRKQVHERVLYWFFPKDWYWRVADPRERDGLPLYRVIPAATPEELTDSESQFDAEDYKSWGRSNANSRSLRYSALDQINKSNVHRLEVAWIFRSGGEPLMIQANPIIVDDRAFFPTTGNHVVAVNATNGELLWRIKTEGRPAHRGLTYWPGSKSIPPRLYFSAGRHLHAVSPDTGAPIADFGNGGRAGRGISRVAPAIAKGVLAYAVVESANANKAEIQGLDVVTGELLWTTGLVEQRDGYERFGVEFDLGGGNPWGGISVDEDRGMLFVTTGDAHPILVGTHRPGRNEHANSVLAIDIESGEILWSFQEIRHDIWDKDIPAPPVVTEIVRDGRRVDVVVAVTKHGNTIILDRLSGKPIFPWRLRRAPVSQIPGEHTAEYQPDVEIPEPFAKQVFTLDDLTDIGGENHEFAREIAEKSTIGFFPPPGEVTESIYFGLIGGAEWPGAGVDPTTGTMFVASNDVTTRSSIVNSFGFDDSGARQTVGQRLYLKNCSSCHGKNREGTSQGPLIYGISSRMERGEIVDIIVSGRRSMPPFRNLNRKALEQIVQFISSRDHRISQASENAKIEERYRYVSRGFKAFYDSEKYPGNKPPWGWLNALDLNTGKMKWRVPLGEDEKLAKRGFKNIGIQNIGGPVVTAGGLVFCAGTTDRLLRAFDKDTGEELWRHEMPAHGSAPPTVYQVDGKQYVLIPAAGWNFHRAPSTSDAFVAFALP